MTPDRPPPLRWPTVSAEEAFPAVVDAVPMAREFVRTVTSGWDAPPGMVDDALLIASELVTNVVRHAQTPVVLSISFDGTRMLVMATDGAPVAPKQVEPAEATETGRGLLLMSSVAAQWGVQLTPLGKTLWACLEVGSGAVPPPVEGDAAPPVTA